ncbi:mucin-binding protein [Limosilactobacillus mucosae]|uniref:YSIRK-type signal peptide-containing protein n=1 Tax=Limosilactobacillus mucosae TaxID=97478 RepID=A0AAJ1HMK7_LIMMU|nr:YSIRK-type signal peptide-containing protein [Limosilactobacillus mucosae]MDC2826833.1 YSIRK-type signal peptide-containing protein [Limosilactobacillus mucosae]MDC2836225.1 YSIRK-type signal peptide-containing protein [Limosilactobacillus mucosae]MDC2853241.1 YSIRK-type signal peptide-containing protein [Limosilactobacillus mucosae]
MLSKNNTYMKKKKTANQAQRFGLRKLSIGTVSVLLGTLLFMGNSEVSADTTTNTTSTDTETNANATTDLNASQVTLSSTNSQAAASEGTLTTSQASSSTVPVASQAAASSVTAASTATTAAAKATTSATPTAAGSETTAKTTATTTPTAETNASITIAEASAATTANSQATSDDAVSAEGKITDEGKTKGLTDNDVAPGMSNANGASLVLDNSSQIPSDYKADPTKGRYTFGIVSLGGDFVADNTGSQNNDTYNDTHSTKYYLRFSTSSTATNGKYDETVFAQVVDGNTDQVIWESSLTPELGTVEVDKLSNVGSDGITYHYLLTYNVTTVNGVTTKTIDINTNRGTQSAKVVYSADGSVGSAPASVVHLNYPSASTIKTEYIAKDAAGNETILAEYEETGRQGYTYTVSDQRTFKGYDLISSPSKTTGTLSSSYNVGDIIVSTQKQLSNTLQIARVNVVTNTDGTAKIVLKVAKLGASIDDIADENVWKTILSTEPVAPGGGYSTEGNYDAGSAHPNGAFLLYTLPKDGSKPIGVKYLTDAGFTEDQLEGYGGYLTAFGLYNRLVPGQEPANYYYAPQGQVRINYVTSDGTAIQAPAAAYENSGKNTTYDVSGLTYKPETITVNGKTYRYVKTDKSLGKAGTTTINGFTYNTTPSDATGTISSNTVNDVYFVYEQVTYHTEAESKDVTRTIEYYDSVTGEPIPSNLESTVTQKATLKRNKIYDDQNNFIGYGTVSEDGSSYTIDDSWQVDDQTWTEQKSADLSDYGYTAPDRASVAAVTVDDDTTNVTEKVYYGHQTVPVTPENPGNPGKPINPKGDVNYPDGVAKDDLADTVTRTINYIDAKGNPVKGGPNGEETITQIVTFERTAIVDKVTGKILGYDTNNDGKVDTENADRAWTPLSAEFSEVKSADPKSLGFDNVDKSTVSTVMIVPGQADLKETVVYSNDPMVVAGTIQYIDVTTSVLLDEDVLPEGEVGTKINYTTADKIKSYESQGYELVLSDFTDGSQVYEKEGNDFVVKLKHKTQTITPNDPNPVTPGEPINPNDPNSPVYPTEVDHKNLIKAATQTIHYVGAGDKTPADKSQTKEDAFTRTVTIDKVTGKVLSTSDWQGSNTFGTEDTPVIDGYHADKKVAGGLTATVDDPDVEETVTYAPNGKLVPVDPNWTPIPGADTPTYTTDPNDPTKVLNPTVPSIDGWKPKDNQPGDSITPKGPGEDTEVPYVQVVSGTIKYVDDTTNATLDQSPLPEGEVGTKINYTTADKIKNYQDLGYELVSNDFTDGSQVYEKVGNDFVVHLKHATKTITPEDPATPGQPINPKGNAEYPNGVAKDDLTETVKRTINYVDAQGKPVNGSPDGASSYVQTVTFKRTAVIDKVTGKLLGYDTNNDGQVDTTDAERAWSPARDEFAEVVSKTPAEVGFTHVDRPTVASHVVLPGDQDATVTVVYSKDSLAVAGTIQYIDDTTGALLDEKALPEGEVGAKINYTTADKIKNYQDLGYELVSNNFSDGTQTYAKDGNDFVVHLKHATKTITPEDPATPGQPINPKGNAEYPNGVAKDDLSDTVTRTINYVDADGNPVKGGPNGETTIKQTVTFKRTVIIDKVTGQLLGYDTNNDGQVDTTDAGRAWSPLHGEFDEVESKTPAEVGYLHVDRPKVNAYGVVPGDQDIVEKVVYSNDPMVVAGTIQYIDDTTGVLLDEDALPEGEVGTKISYTTADKIKNYENKGYELVSNNFTDGAQTYSKDGNDFVVHLKHKTQTITPNDPDLVTPGEPINPNDPNSPVYPPATARENLIKAATQTIHYVGAGDQTPADKVQTKEDAFTRTVTIDKVTGKVLSTSDWQGSETFGTENTPVVDGYHADKKTAGGLTATVADPNVEETVTYTPNAKIVPVDPNGNPIPGADTPTYPTDPTDPTKVVPNEPIPDVPGYTPVDPSPITPTDPGKDTPVPYTQNQYGLTEQFVDEDGNELSPSVSKGSSYKHGDAFDVTGDAKVINGYVLVKQENTKGTFGNGDETAKFIYKKLGRIIPVDPNGNPIPGADTPIYQNDPNDPSKVVPNEPTPTVPGYTPSTPSVTPADPTKDTPVPYTKNETPTNPSEPTTPANPTNPSEPTAPGTPTNPTEPSPAVPGQTTPANQQAASSASEDKSVTLPQTGNDQNETAAAAGLGLAGLSSLLALFGTRKKRHED